MIGLGCIDLHSFVHAWTASQPHAPPAIPYEKAGPHTGITLYRDDKHQVQLWICPPNSSIGEHAHEHAESYAVRVSGKIAFLVFDSKGERIRHVRCTLGGRETLMVHVPQGARHSAKIGPSGAAFLSITKWDEAPVSVHLDWTGEPLDEAHKAALGRS